MKKQQNYPLYDVKPVPSIRQMLYDAESEAGAKIAFKYKNGDETVSVTYSEFAHDVKSLGTAIAKKGIHGAHLACLSENSYDYIVAFLAAITSDNVFVPVDKELPPKEIVYILTNSDADYLFHSDTFTKMLKENQSELPRIKSFINFDGNEEEVDGKYVDYKKLLAHGRASFDSGSRAYLDQTYNLNTLKMLVYTSGTTGIAKGVMLSDHNLSSMVHHGLRVSTVFDTGLSVLPYNHTYEAVAGILVGIHKHVTICINDKIRNIAKNLNEFKPAYIYIVPAIAEAFYKKIWNSAKESGQDAMLRRMMKFSNGLRKIGIDLRRTIFKKLINQFGGNLIKIVCGGAPIRPEIGEFFDAIGINLINGYGITECSPLVAANRDYFNNFHTCGTVLPCLEIRIDDPDEDGNGEICVKGDTVMLGYYKNEEETRKAIVDGWFHTGDYGRMNEDEQLMITGRKKNMIILSNGKNVYPEEIENYIMNIPYVQEVVVYSKKDAMGSEVALIAETYLNEEKLAEMNITEPVEQLKNDVTEVCKPLPFYKQVAKVIIRRELFEKTATQKINRKSISGDE